MSNRGIEANLTIGGHFWWNLLPTFLRISYFLDRDPIIFTKIDKFHKFWWIFEFRYNIYKYEPNWENSRAGRPAYPLWKLVVQLYNDDPKHKIKQRACCLTQASQVKTERLAPSPSNWIHLQWLTKESRPKLTWGTTCNRLQTCQNNERPRQARARPAGP